MLAKRIIPCLDVKDGRVVKGVNFVELRDAGDPVAQARFYDSEGADELVFLDITATHEARGTVMAMARAVADQVFIPFTVGGGIRSVDDMRAILRAGADKVSVNSAAVRAPQLIAAGATEFGSQAIVVAIDARRRPDGVGWEDRQRWANANRAGRAGVGAAGRGIGRGRAAADEHGRRRHAGGLRPGADPRRGRGGRHPGDCLRRGGDGRALRRRADRRPRRRRPGGIALPLSPTERRPSEKLFADTRDSCKRVTTDCARLSSAAILQIHER